MPVTSNRFLSCYFEEHRDEQSPFGASQDFSLPGDMATRHPCDFLLFRCAALQPVSLGEHALLKEFFLRDRTFQILT